MSIRIATDAVLIRVGVEPNISLFDGQISSDFRGYIAVNHDCETDISYVYAIGDVIGGVSPTISTAAGNGATAAKAIAAELNP